MSLSACLGLALRLAAVFAVGAAVAFAAELIEQRLPFLTSVPDPGPLYTWWGTAGLAWVCIAVEVPIVGWRRSALRRILVGRSASTNSDLAYQSLGLSGGYDVLVRLTGLGLVDYVIRLGDRDAGLLPLHQLPLWAALPLILIVGSFVAYWEHRALHSRWLWPVHKSHHSPTEMTMINAGRTHPVELVMGAVVLPLPMILLGFAPEHLALFAVWTSFSVYFVHSHWTSIAWLDRCGIYTAAGHRIHHAIDPAYHDRNFGDLLNIWDRLFGTYVAPGADIDQLEIGVDALPGRHNTSNPFREIALQTMDWLAVVRREAFGRDAAGRESTSRL